MIELLIIMAERLGIIVMIAFILTRLPFFKNMIYQEQLNHRQQVIAVIFFGAFGIIGTYTGVTLNTDSLQLNPRYSELTVDEAIANFRVIGVVIAGLLGGYKIGIGAGLIAGIHRFTLGGFTAISCGFATIIAGFLSGLLYKKNKHVKLHTAFLIGFVAESIQMLIILLLSRPFEKAWALVEIIGLPMILANGIGSTLFLLIIKSVINEEEKALAIQAQNTLHIAEKTLTYLRNGLTEQTSHTVCTIIHKELHISAVSITNSSQTLAHVGDSHTIFCPGNISENQTTLYVEKFKENASLRYHVIQCPEKSCLLRTAVIAPLKQREETIGTLIFYFRSSKEITPVMIKLISGLSSLLSHQLEMANADKSYQLAKEVEIKTLQAQISPHFLFNSLNTILSLIRLDPVRARKLLISLSHFIRQNLTVTTQTMTTLEQELHHVKAYLEIEETRFANKLSVFYEVEDDTLAQYIPPLTLQPIVENAIKHGMKNKERDCFLKIAIYSKNQAIVVKVTDNGLGMSQKRINQIIKTPIPSETGAGLALYNVNRRLTMMYGATAALQIQSELNKGTEIVFSLPYRKVG
ncbi:MULTISPECIES: LytS/YhcK type 5TM receptor domain-containing protein [Bacillus]|uniref:LytS/YhcK type 5TM receptor domain-containing protein n=1 Tax=Bacillus TaxID=1386 RepID=UPI0002F9EC79|nr:MULTISPECIES: LytS/YhcK type 5TM receptor domain-containing protein [Bacillus]